MCGLCAGFEQIGVRENVRVFGKSAKIVRFLRKKLWHKNRIKKLPRAFFECAGYVRVLSKLVCGKMCGFLENRPNSCGFYQKNYGNTGKKLN